MIVPSIDLLGGSAVQLRQGAQLALDAGDPFVILERFARVGKVALIDLDGALARGDNRELMQALLERASCRVGGGIRSLEAAVHWLDHGASEIILGTAAEPDLLAKLPRERVIVALDARHDEVVVEGWRRATGISVAARMRELRPYVDAFMVTFVESEGMLQGLPIERVKPLIEAAQGARLSVAGGIQSCREIAELDALGVDVQVGMALYTGKIQLSDAFSAPLVAKLGHGLWPTLVCDQAGRALGLAYSNSRSLQLALESGRGIYFSRSRNEIWEKGKSSGATQELLGVDLDCDRDTLRFTVRQAGIGFCHQGTATCWGPLGGMARLERTLAARREQAPPSSYSSKLFHDKDLLQAKLSEEAGELAAASRRQDVAEEAADLFFFAQAKLVAAGVALSEVEAVLDRRALRVTRRPGAAKLTLEAEL